MGADLHLHSLVSDGLATAPKVVERCHDAGITTLALTDHDDIRGYLEAIPTAEKLGLELIPGVEVSAVFNGSGVHILGYGFRPQDPDFLDFLARNRQAKRVQIEEIARRLRGMGLAIDPEALLAGRPDDAYLGRSHLARALLRLVRHRSTIYTRYIGSSCPAFVPALLASARDTIDAIHAAGGVAVLAHPSLDDLSLVLPHLVDFGLDGVEAYRPKRSRHHQDLTASAAFHADLCVTGGSDWHGEERDASPGSPLWPRQRFADFFARLEKARA